MMTTQFEKQEFNKEYNHKDSVINMFNEIGYTNIQVDSCLTNGLSCYVHLTVDVLNENKCWSDMIVYDNKADITIRISDHSSGLERNCGGVSGNKMTINAFKKLIETGAIKSYN